MTLGAYIHVPFCASRCGYCDFNTYTAQELIRDGSSVSVSTYVPRVIAEIQWTREHAPDLPVINTVFFGGGTPTLLAPSDIGTVLSALKSEFGLAADAEVTIEANPDSVQEETLHALRTAGVTRVSFGHQSSAPQVLKFLERTHTPGRTWEAVSWAKNAGFEHISVDLIYGAPAETDDDLQRTLDDVCESDVDHVSAYSLIVESGTRLAASIARGQAQAPQDDVAADRYAVIDRRLRSGGFDWYEVSNWAKDGGQCRHNLGYWRGDDWLGIGPGAHAHVQGRRQWNLRHPAAWAAAVDAGTSAVDGHEDIDEHTRAREDVMLRLRLHEGLPHVLLSSAAIAEAHKLSAEGLIEMNGDAWVLTDAGRLLADGVIARLWD